MRINGFIKNFGYNTNFNGTNRPKVSVVLPIYNQEKYLSSALDSLQKQTLSDTEFICVNDGSTDDTPRILKSYAEKDRRVKIINQKNQGSGTARNTGLSAARGEYIAFLDPDDTFEHNALETLYGKSKKLGSDMLVFNFKRVEENGETRWKSDVQNKIGDIFRLVPERTFTWRDFKTKVFEGLYWMVWNKLYKTDFVNDSELRFSDCCLAEDNLFTFGATLCAEKIGFTPEYLYNYTRHENTAVHKCTDKNLCIFDVVSDVKDLIAKLGLKDELGEEFAKYVITIFTYHAKQIPSKDKLVEMCKKQLSVRQYETLKENNII